MRKIRTLTIVGTLGAILVIGALGQPAQAALHGWDINEIYSNADGTIQFIEMVEGLGLAGETVLTSGKIKSNANEFTFPSNLLGDTTFKKVLIATSAFAALPGTPTPDYDNLPDNFFATTGDTLTFMNTDDITIYDTITFVSGELPLCGTLSMNDDKTTGTNSPTNFAGGTGPITIIFAPLGDLNGDCLINLLDLSLMASLWMIDCLTNPGLPDCAS